MHPHSPCQGCRPIFRRMQRAIASSLIPTPAGAAAMLLRATPAASLRHTGAVQQVLALQCLIFRPCSCRSCSSICGRCARRREVCQSISSLASAGRPFRRPTCTHSQGCPRSCLQDLMHKTPWCVRRACCAAGCVMRRALRCVVRGVRVPCAVCALCCGVCDAGRACCAAGCVMRGV